MKQKPLTGFTLFLRVVSFAKPFWKPLLVVFCCTLGVALAAGVCTYYFSEIFKLLQEHGTDIVFYKKAQMLMALSAAFALLRIIIIYYQGRTEVNKLDMMIPNHLNYASIAKFFGFSNGQHVNEHSGVKQTIVNNGVASIQNQINTMIGQLFPALSLLVVSMGILFYAHWSMGCFFIVGAMIFSSMMIYHNKKSIPGIRKMRDRRQLNSRLMSELFRLVHLVKSENQENRSLIDVTDAQQKQQDIFTETWNPGNTRLAFIRLVSNTISYSARAFAIYLYFKQKIDIGMIFLIFSYSTNFVDSLWQLTNIHKQFLIDKTNIEKYFELLEVKSDIVVIQNPIHPKSFFGQIEFKNVTFQYPKRVKSHEEDNDAPLQDEPVLKDVSITFNAGERTGIVGESGSGKSSLAGLLRRDFDPQQGQILIDGHDLRLLDLSWYLQNLGNVDQEVNLFDRSIRENILFGSNVNIKEFPEERLKEIAKMTRIDGFFERLEHGFDTIVGEKGVKLSGGERQRIGIARALAKDPAILIFDEATSALDSMSERIVQSSIDEASKGKTAIVIAHRLSTVKNCDRILVFRQGILLGEGTHEELLKTCEYYEDLVQHQLMS